MNRHVRTYRRLLRVYPDEFRSSYADEMTRLFADQLVDAKGSLGSFAVARLWVATLLDLFVTAPGHHLQKEALVLQPADVPSTGPAHRQPVGPASAPKVLLGLLPLWLFAFFELAAPGFMEPALANPPSVLGVPAGVVPLSIALVLTGLGVVGLRRVSTTTGAGIVFLCLTVPAALAVVLTPAMVLVLQNAAA